jgi:hypothetical protein
MRGLDPRIHLSSMDCRGKPGNDGLKQKGKLNG